MERQFHFYNIVWDDDEEQGETGLNLPDSYTYRTTDPEFDPENEGANVLSDQFSFCVKGFAYEEITV